MKGQVPIGFEAGLGFAYLHRRFAIAEAFFLLGLAERPVFEPRRCTGDNLPALVVRKAPVAGNKAKQTELQGKARCHLFLGRRRARLVIDNGKTAVGQPVDPVGAAHNLYAVHLHRAGNLARQHGAAFGLAFAHPFFEAGERGDQTRLPQRPEQRMDALGGEMRGGKGRDRHRRVAQARLVPLVENVVHQRAAQRRVTEGIGSERIKPPQVEDRLRVELVGIAQQPVERGDLDRHIAQPRLGIGRGARIRRGDRAQPVKMRQQRGDGAFAVLVCQILAQQRLDPQQEARRQRRPLGIAQGAAQHHLRRPQGPGKVMRGKADAEFCPRHAERAQNRGRQQRVRARRLRP